MMAALQMKAVEKGCNINVMMPYADSLKYMADWFAQLWAESLGKAVHTDGSAAHTGQTPVKSLGVTDQHSQVQLYTEGPFDKVITFIGVDKYRSTVEIPHAYDNIPDVAFLSGHTFNELIKCEQFATEYAVQKSGHMNCTVTLPEVNALLEYLSKRPEVVLATGHGSPAEIDALLSAAVEKGISRILVNHPFCMINATQIGRAHV